MYSLNTRHLYGFVDVLTMQIDLVSGYLYSEVYHARPTIYAHVNTIPVLHQGFQDDKD